MSKLFGFFGKRKKKKNHIPPTFQNEDIVIYKVIEPPRNPYRASEFSPHDVDSSENLDYQQIRSHPVSNLLVLSKDNLFENTSEDGMTYIPKNRTADSHRLSFIKPEDHTRRRQSSGRLSVVVPLSNTGPETGQRRVSRILDTAEGFVSEVQPRRLSQVEEGLRTTRLYLTDPTRPSTSQPVVGVKPNKQVRLSVVKPIEINEQPGRSHPASNLLILSKDNLFESTPVDGMSYIPKNKTVDSNRLSLIKPEEPTRRRQSSGRLSVVFPLSNTGPEPGQRRVSRILDTAEGFVSEVQPRRLSQVEEGPRTTRLYLIDPTRPSKSQPVVGVKPNKQVRSSVVKPIEINEQPGKSHLASNLLNLSKDNLFESTPVDGMSYIPKNRTVDSNRLSFIKPEEPTRRRQSSGRLSVVVPLSNTGPETEQRRVSRILDTAEGFVSEVQPRRLSQVEEGPRTTRLYLIDPTRPSTNQPVLGVTPNKQVRLSVVKPIEINEQSGRLSMVKPLDEAEDFPLNVSHQPVVYAVRRSSNKPEKRQSISLKRFFTRKKDAEEEEEDTRIAESQAEQMVYAVPATVTRGRTRSILNQSVKSLTSKKEEPPVAWKNIRYSTVTDVFSADVKRINEKPPSSGYVNMERGQGMLVSELLNPITSIFVSDLKDPVPKDPLRRPRELNNWVRPRQNSVRQVVTPKQPQKQTQRVKVSVAPVTTPASKMHSKLEQKRRYSDYESEDESLSSYSEDESYHGRSKYSAQRKPAHHRVYAATIPDVFLPDVMREMEGNKVSAGNIPPPEAISPLPSKHSFSSDPEEEEDIKLLQPPNVGRLSLAQKTDIKDALNFLCHPPEGNQKM